MNNNTVEPDLSVSLGSAQLANPVMTASGTCGYAFELRDFLDISQLGGFITKSVTLNQRSGNPPQRTFETTAGMLNAIGLANVGLDRFCEEKLPLLEKMTIPVFVNVAGSTIGEYVEVARRLSRETLIGGLEINISCPNVSQGGITFGTDAKTVHKLVAAVRQACPDTLLIVKLTPNVTDITIPARAAIEAGADVLSLVNTFVGMAIDIRTCKPVLANRTGGLSGPAIKPMAIYMVNRVYEQVAKQAQVPIIGLGGISCGSDALEFIIAGASAVSVGTQMMIDPKCVSGIIEDIGKYLVRHGLKSIRELVGSVR